MCTSPSSPININVHGNGGIKVIRSLCFTSESSLLSSLDDVTCRSSRSKRMTPVPYHTIYARLSLKHRYACGVVFALIKLSKITKKSNCYIIRHYDSDETVKVNHGFSAEIVLMCMQS